MAEEQPKQPTNNENPVSSPDEAPQPDASATPAPTPKIADEREIGEEGETGETGEEGATGFEETPESATETDSDPRRMVLEMVSSGKLTAEQGARILELLNRPSVEISDAPPPAEAPSTGLPQSGENAPYITQGPVPPMPPRPPRPPMPPRPSMPPRPPRPPMPPRPPVIAKIAGMPDIERMVERSVEGVTREIEAWSRNFEREMEAWSRQFERDMQEWSRPWKAWKSEQTGQAFAYDDRTDAEEASAQDMPASRRVSVRVGDGDVTVNASPDDRIYTFTACRQQKFADALELRFEEEAVLQLPSDCEFSARTGDGNIEVEGIAFRRVELHTGDGDVRLNQISGDVDVRTGDGNIHVADSDVGRLVLHTGDGDIEVSDAQNGIEAHTGDGEIRLANCSGQLSLTSGDGELSLEDCSGAAALRAESGNVRVLGGDYDHLTVTSGDGDIRVEASAQYLRARSGSGSVEARLGETIGLVEMVTEDGDIDVELPESLACTIEASTGDGEIHTDFEEDGERSRRRWHGKRHGGGPAIRLRTGSGNVSIRLRR
jgi:DUF4097 and DUF4098 domain-containing protein YvlB